MLGGTFTKPPAGLGAAQWERENTALGKKRRSSLLPPHSSYLLMDSPLCLFPIIQQVPALVPVRQHSSQRLLSFFAPFQNFNLISFSCLHVFVWRAAEGDLWDAAFSIVLPLRQRPRLTAPACSRPQTPSLLAAARDSSGRVERHHSRGPPQSPSNGRRCFGLDESRCRTEQEGTQLDSSYIFTTGGTFSHLFSCFQWQQGFAEL